MANAKKLPSGAWNASVYSHTDENGKRKYISITANTKNECELKAAEFKANKRRLARRDLTIADAIEGYITAKEGVLSPASIREYRRLQKSEYKSINNMHLYKITTADLQLFVSEMSRRMSPKSVRDRYGLLNAAIRMYQPDIAFRVTLPQKMKKRPVSPSEEAVKALLENSTGKLHICIQLGIRGFRREEIAALKYEDIKDGVAHIHAVMVEDQNHKWVYKECPKTEGSDRFVKVPALGDGEGFIIGWTPGNITNSFAKLRKELGIEGIRFHDLRHYFASTAAVLQIPDIYTADMGGWSRANGAPVLKTVYQNNLVSMSNYYQDKIDNYLNGLEDIAK